MTSLSYGETMSTRLAELSSALLGATRALRKSGESNPPGPIASVEGITIASEMKCTRTDTAAECRLRIEGSLDVHSAPEIRAVFDSIVAAQREVVILELEGLRMLDSSGVGAIVSLFKRVKAAGGSVLVQGVQNQPLAVCKLLKLDRVFGL